VDVVPVPRPTFGCPHAPDPGDALCHDLEMDHGASRHADWRITGGPSRWRPQRLDRVSLTDQVRSQLRQAILEGRIGPGEPLREVQLADSFRTGRSAVREALRQLVQEGLVDAHPHQGARVRTISPDDLADIYSAREAIESAAVAHALQPHRQMEPTELVLAHERIRAAWCGQAASSLVARAAANLEFHRAIVGLAGSPRLARVYEPLAAESEMAINLGLVELDHDSTDVHGRILTAIRDRSAKAVLLVQRHLRLT